MVPPFEASKKNAKYEARAHTLHFFYWPFFVLTEVVGAGWLLRVQLKEKNYTVVGIC